MTTTDNLDLNLFSMGTDPDISFEELRLGLNGPTNSNMTMIDDFAGTIITLLPLLTTFTTGSLVSANNFITNASGSITAITGSLVTINSTFQKLAEFSGSGQADFNSIPQDFSHIIILGVGSVNYGDMRANVGCDFNADTDIANYRTLRWDMSGSLSGSVSGSISGSAEVFVSSSAIAQLLIGNVSGSLEANYGGTIFSVIPCYSGSVGNYKTAMGLSTNHFVEMTGIMQAGGVWKSASPITRIRIFGSSNNSGSIRYNFLEGTKISLYGLI